MDYESIMLSILIDTGDKEKVLEYYEKKYDDISAVIIDNPSFDLKYRDGGKTMIVHVKKEDMKW